MPPCAVEKGEGGVFLIKCLVLLVGKSCGRVSVCGVVDCFMG